MTAAAFLLRCVDAAGMAIELELPDGEITVGRSSSCTITFNDSQVSREHARIRVSGTNASIEDAGSSNGTYVNGEKLTAPKELHPGDTIRVGESTLDLTSLAEGETQIVASAEGVLEVLPVAVDSDRTQVLAPVARPAPAPRVRGLVSDDMLAAPVISEQELIDNGVEVKVTEFAALGAGVGSFVWADLLRCSGVAAADISVIGIDATPYERYARLCGNSQIPLHERLRSNSDSCPDNVWGFPGYAVREAWHDMLGGRMVPAASALWSIFGEPAIAQTYTPRSGDVFRSIDKEAARIGWSSMLMPGRIRHIRKTREGRLLAVISQSTDRERKHVAVSATYMHIALGYPAIQLLPDLADYREKYEDVVHVVNAYEPHDHAYQHLRQHGGTVLLRGRGIVASRIIQRLYEERKHNKSINIVHLHRTRLTGGHRFGASKRAVIADAEYQPFNWPKAGWGGQTRVLLEEASDAKRADLLAVWGGTTTARRGDWDRIVAEGLREGWYRPEYGKIIGIKPGDGGRVVTSVENTLTAGGKLELAVDYVIDCTGLVASPERSPVWGDLISTYGLAKNPLGRIAVANDFEIEGLRHERARAYTCGAVTLGGPYAPVDSFLGLQYAALRANTAIQSQGAKGLHRLSGPYSVIQWLKWARGAAP